MADEVKNKNLFGGFDAIFDQYVPSSNEDNELPEVDPEEIKKTMGSLDDKQDDDSKKIPAKVGKESTVKPKKVEKKIEEEPEEELEEEDEEEIEKPATSKKESDEESDEVDLEEKEIVEAFSDLFADELGWKYEDDEKPNNIKDLVKHIQTIVDENSQPKYANDEVKEIDEFVKNGGRVEDFYRNVYRSELKVDNLDLTKEDDQKAVIRENLRNRGYSESRIDKLISRYEEAESLEEESKDSLDEVKEFKEKVRKELLETQKNRQEAELREQLSFVRNVEKIAKDMDNVLGIPISDKDKKETLEYIFKPERDGSTKYQKEYMSDLKNLFVSAYLTKNKNTLVNNIQKKATSDAVKNLKLKLKSQGKSTKNTHSEVDESVSKKVVQLWDIAGDELRSF